MNVADILHEIALREKNRTSLLANNLHEHENLVKEFLNAVGYGIYLVQQAGIGKVAGVLDSGLVNPLEECTSVTVLTNRAFEKGDIEIECSPWKQLPISMLEDMRGGPGGFVYIVVEEKATTDQLETLEIPPGQNKVLIWSKRKGKFDGME